MRCRSPPAPPHKGRDGGNRPLQALGQRTRWSGKAFLARLRNNPNYYLNRVHFTSFAVTTTTCSSAELLSLDLQRWLAGHVHATLRDRDTAQPQCRPASLLSHIATAESGCRRDDRRERSELIIARDGLGHLTQTPASMPSRILPLSQDAISRIQSSKQITSLSGVALALVQNSLDAGSTKIDVSVNFGRGSCTVEDNGTGIPRVEFFETGGLGKMHHTSKATSDRPLHGNTGTYLASLAALSLLKVSSRHGEDNASSSISIHQGRVISRQIASHQSDELSAFNACGTRVIVNDLFGNMPVRVKQRALTSTPASTERSWVELKRDMAALLLAWNMPCSVKLRDDENHGRSVTVAGNHHNVASSLTERNLNQLQGKASRYDLRDAFPVVFQAGLAPFETRRRWVPVSASTSKLSCRGMICLDPAPTRLCQFVSIGIHPYLATEGNLTIYDLVNKVFADSDFGTVEQNQHPGEMGKGQYVQDRDSPSKGLRERQARTSKGVDRWPMFIIQLELKDRGDNSELDEHQLKGITEVLEAVMKQWLTANGFRPRQKRKLEVVDRTASQDALEAPNHFSEADGELHARGTVSPHFQSPDRSNGSTSKRQRIAGTSRDRQTVQPTAVSRQGSIFDVAHLSKIKTGSRDSHDFVGPHEKHGSGTSRPKIQELLASSSAHFSLPPLERGALGTGQKKDFSQGRASSEPPYLKEASSSDDYGSISDSDMVKAAASTCRSNEALPCDEAESNPYNQMSHDYTVDWQDPITKAIFRVNSRTGIVLPAPDRSLDGVSRSAGFRPTSNGTATTPAGRPLTLAGRAVSNDRQPSDHTVPSFVQSWQNPVFERQTEQSIPVALDAYTDMKVAANGHSHSHNNSSNYFATHGYRTQSNLSKVNLQHVRIINQVDAKFILCIMPAEDDSQSLVLVDQHAASERIILESLLRELCFPINMDSPAARLRTNTGCVSTVATTLLEQPIVFEVTAEETNLLNSHAQHFARYGVLYDLHTVSRTRPTHSIAIRTLPPGIAERCRLFPKLLIDLLRSEIWSRAESGKQAKAAPAPSSKDTNDDHAWLNQIGSCPKGLLDMLNSRACRSAVMFNDVLSVWECEDLLERLGKCAFPFMCAHGRVSMVPVGGIGEERLSGRVVGERLGGRVEGEAGEGFGRAWRRWKGGAAG